MAFYRLVSLPLLGGGQPAEQQQPAEGQGVRVDHPLQARSGEAERRWMGASATLTMVESTTTISCAVAMTSKASPSERWRPGSAGPACARAAMDRVPDMTGLPRNRLPAR